MKSTFHTIATQLEQFANRLAIQPSIQLREFSPIIDTNIIPDIVYTRNDDGSNADLHFYTDGSLMNLGTPDIKLGIGWVQVSDNGLILSDYSANVQSQWPSSTKAETMAIISILEQLIPDSSVTFYLDSLSTITNLTNILHPSIKFNNNLLKKINHSLWFYIDQLIRSKNISITLNKLKSHSGHILNDRSDQLAKAGAQSDFGYKTTIETTLDHLVQIFYCTNIQVDTNIRSFIKDVHSAQLFSDILSLVKMARYDRLKDSINWPVTWSLASFSLYAGSSKTNFREDKIQNFRRKLMFDELPTMDNLCRRKPEIYNSEWNCFHCNLVRETCAHIWLCTPTDSSKWSRKEALKLIINLARDSLKRHLIKIDRNRSNHTTLDWLPEIAALPC